MSSLQNFVSGVIFVSALVGVGGFNGYYHYTSQSCHFNPNNLGDVEFLLSYWFNKEKDVEFNSTVGKFEGHTEVGVRQAEAWNNDKTQLANWQARKDTFCRTNNEIFTKAILTKTAEPIVKLQLGKPSSGSHPTLLMCSAYDFYPRMIRVTWFRDGKEVTSGDVIASEELADGDWYYQIHSHLEFTPKAGEKISCVVEHASFKDPKELVWDPSMPEPERNKFAIGAAGLVLGLIVTAAGFIYYKTKARGRILVPTN